MKKNTKEAPVLTQTAPGFPACVLEGEAARRLWNDEQQYVIDAVEKLAIPALAGDLRKRWEAGEQLTYGVFCTVAGIGRQVEQLLQLTRGMAIEGRRLESVNMRLVNDTLKANVAANDADLRLRRACQVLDQILNEPASAAVEQTARLILSEEQSLRNRDVIRAGRTA